MRNNLLKAYFFVLALFLSALCLTGVSNAGNPLIFAVHPYLPATELIDRFSPLIDYLERKTGYDIEISISRDYETHIDRIGRDQVGVAYMGPASYLKMVEKYGKKPLLARLQVHAKPTFRGVIIVREESPILTLKDLAGKRFAFGDPDSTMSHLVPRHMLKQAGVDIDQLGGYTFMSNHNNVALGVLVGDYDAGAVKEEVFYKYSGRGLRVLMPSRSISEHLFVAGSRLSSDIIQKLQNALLSIGTDKEGREIMTSIKHSITGMVSVRDEDYDNLRRILEELGDTGADP